MKKTVVELFAGVGGFRIGLNNIKSINKSGRAIEKGDFLFVWTNQWEPSTKQQHAFNCYNTRFPDKHNSNVDISRVNKSKIPHHTLLCAGFPCQDYSVARSLSNSKGIKGKKGVLWWQINELLTTQRTKFVLLENVDRLLRSPAKQKGRDFGIILRCLSDLGYIIEWRVINSADYGHAQRRRRTYIFAYHNSTKYANKIKKEIVDSVLTTSGIFATAFPVQQQENIKITTKNLRSYKEISTLSNKFKFKFENAGFVIDGQIYTAKTTPVLSNSTLLKNVVKSCNEKEFLITREKLKKFKY